jgi:hypothetical protein
MFGLAGWKKTMEKISSFNVCTKQAILAHCASPFEKFLLLSMNVDLNLNSACSPIEISNRGRLLLGHKTQQQIGRLSNHSNEPSFLALLSSSEPSFEYVFNNRRAAIDLNTS